VGRGGSGATVGIFVLLAFAALYWAQPILMPVLLAMVVGVVLTPVLILAEKFGDSALAHVVFPRRVDFRRHVLCGRAACGSDW
jgi:predicted PurR-regulated permease PerM